MLFQYSKLFFRYKIGKMKLNMKPKFATIKKGVSKKEKVHLASYELTALCGQKILQGTKSYRGRRENAEKVKFSEFQSQMQTRDCPILHIVYCNCNKCDLENSKASLFHRSRTEMCMTA